MLNILQPLHPAGHEQQTCSGAPGCPRGLLMHAEPSELHEFYCSLTPGIGQERGGADEKKMIKQAALEESQISSTNQKKTIYKISRMLLRIPVIFCPKFSPNPSLGIRRQLRMNASLNSGVISSWMPDWACARNGKMKCWFVGGGRWGALQNQSCTWLLGEVYFMALKIKQTEHQTWKMNMCFVQFVRCFRVWGESLFDSDRYENHESDNGLC